MKHIPKDASKCFFYWVIKNVCNSKTIMLTASHNDASPQEMSYFLCLVKNFLLGWKNFFLRGLKGGKKNFPAKIFRKKSQKILRKKIRVKTTKGKLSNSHFAHWPLCHSTWFDDRKSGKFSNFIENSPTFKSAFNLIC